MCSPTTCRTCSKTTWAGCGNHVAQVRAVVPAHLWCDGHAASAPAHLWCDGHAASAPAHSEGGFLSRLLGR